MGPVFVLAALPAVARAQQVSVGTGVGTVRFAGGSSFSSATLSPTAQWLSPSFFLGANASVSALKGGVWAGQSHADLWAALSRRTTRPYPAVSAGFAASNRSDGVAAASANVIGELTLPNGAGAEAGVALGAGAVTGVIEHVNGVTALRLRTRGWWQRSLASPQLSLSVESTRFLGAWYSDVLAGATLDRGRMVASAWATARLSAAYPSTGAASAALQYFVTPTIALEAAGGSYLRDPFQGLPRAGYVSAGVRWHAADRVLAPPPELVPRLTPLVASRRGDSVVVRFQMDGARSVAIAGNWNAWRPKALRRLGGDIWEGAFMLAPGTYHFNLLVNGREWVVPGGVAAVSDGMGGLVAVLMVL